MAEKPPLPKDIEVVLDRCFGEMRERLVGELKVAETEAEKLEILARFRREIGDVRDKVSGRAGISIGQRWALIGAGLAVFAAGVVTTLLLQDKQQAAPAAGPKECPPCPKASDPDKESGAAGDGGPPNPGKFEASDGPATPKDLIGDYMAGVRDRAAADRASAWTAEALNASLERLKRDYIEALRRSRYENLTDAERKYAEEDAKSYAEMLRKQGINPDSLNKDSEAPDAVEPVPVDPPAEPALPSGPQGRDLLR